MSSWALDSFLVSKKKKKINIVAQIGHVKRIGSIILISRQPTLG